MLLEVHPFVMKPPALCDVDTRPRKEKKRRRMESLASDLRESSQPVDEALPRKKPKKNQEEETSLLAGDFPVSPSPLVRLTDCHNRKKKKKKRQEEEGREESFEGGRGEQQEEVEDGGNETGEKKKKKKKKHRQTQEVDNGGNETVEKEKRKKKYMQTVVQEEEEEEEVGRLIMVTLETNGTGKKTRKKKKNHPTEENLAMETDDRKRETDSWTEGDTSEQDRCVSMGTKESRRKQRMGQAEEMTDHNNSKTMGGNDRKEKKVPQKQQSRTTQASPETAPLTKTEKTEKSKKTKRKQNEERKEVEEQNRGPRKRRKEGNVGQDGQMALVDRGTQQEVMEILPEVLELQHFIPNVLSKSQDQIKKLLRYDLSRFQEFRRKGITLRSGRCSDQENQQIRDNVADFLVLTGISSASQLFFPQRYKEREVEIRRLRVQHRFFERIAEDIPRPCHQVHIRAKKMFDKQNHMGRFSEEEIHTLKKLQRLHGNDWKTISQKMNRSVYALEKRFAQLACRHGAWDSEEVDRLMQAMMGLFCQNAAGSSPVCPWLSREQLSNNLPWKDISEQVQTRSWSQCREKWFTHLKEKMACGRPAFSGGIKTLEAKLNLINTLYNMKAEDVTDIDWDQVAHVIGKVTAYYLQKSFHRLKVSSIPNWPTLSYCEIIDFLQQNVVPQLKSRLSKVKSVEWLKAQGDQDLYLFSDIFSKKEEEEEESRLTTA
ncbi:transcription termination factor 1-like isoform X2 [Lampris incognitus]|uniref:transcription termination factor 1-like isoform X2 n=1 Tax=Lampris incognitus TaxID=2546036 RepID=UPI0024B538D3|nr:transcription termination factor 1-like isoform X2 [Lampris incognitus]